jgi:hypothetical protein
MGIKTQWLLDPTLNKEPINGGRKLFKMRMSTTGSLILVDYIKNDLFA